MKSVFILLLVLLALPLNSQTFEDVFPEMGIQFFAIEDGIMSGGVVVFDYDGDGYEDLFFTGGFRKPRLYKNNPNATRKEDRFLNVTNQANVNIPDGVTTFGAAAGDLNNDGHLDLIVTTGLTQRSYVYMNNGDGTFTEMGLQLGMPETSMSTSISLGDVNNDGWLDIYFTNYFANDNTCLENYLYINDSGLRFYELAVNYEVNDAGCGLASTLSDYDNDGDLDLFVANDFGMNFSSNVLFKNDFPNPRFIDVRDESGFNDEIFGMGVEGGDFNEDGHLDYYATNIGYNPLHRSNGDGTFSEVAKDLGVDDTYVNPNAPPGQSGETVGWGIAWFDYNHDMNLDLYVNNGFLSPVPGINTEYSDRNRLFRNNGNSDFEFVGNVEGIDSEYIGRGCAMFDYDNDGDMDILSAICRPREDDPAYNDGEYYQLFENKLDNGKNYLKLRLIGSSIQWEAIGSHAFVHVGGRKLMREVNSGGGSYLSQHSRILHFGLDTHEKIDSIEVFWIGRRDRSVRYNIDANQMLTIIQEYRDTLQTSVCKGEFLLGRVWDETGVHDSSFVAINGADSIVTTIVYVNEDVTNEVNIDVCYGEVLDEIEWKENGSYDKSFSADNGCDSVVTYNVSVIPIATGIIDTTICYAGFYDGREYIESQTIEKKLTSYLGCDSILYVNIEVMDTPNSQETVEVCFGESFRDETIFEDMVLNDRFQTEEGCDSIHTIRVYVLESKHYRDTVLLDKGEEYNGKQYFEDDMIIENHTAENGCDSTYTLYVKIKGIGSVFQNYKLIDVNLRLSPNPAKDIAIISFELKEDSYTVLSICDFMGNEIIEVENNYNNIGLYSFNTDLSRLTSGVYFLKLQVDEKYQILKFIVE